AARTVARPLFQTDNALGAADAELLLFAWLEAARAVLAARGCEGLLRLMPAARNLSHRMAGQEARAETIADAIRRVASRIANAENALERMERRSPQSRIREREARGAHQPSKRVVVRG